MKIPFLNRFTGSVLCEIEIGDDVRAELRVKVALEKAVRDHANLRDADLGGANLRYANLVGANLRDADLGGANLRYANLVGANLGGANLRDANLGGANLGGANLRYANLVGANLGGANLGDADLRYANLGGANLGGANLDGANLAGASLPHFAHCPEEGSFIAWKKLDKNCVAKLEIPAEAKRTSSPIGRKMRAEFVKTLAIFARDGNAVDTMCSKHDLKIIYRVGEITRPDRYNSDPRIECTNGIHFFITRKEAETH